MIINVVCSSSKRHDELQAAYENEIICLVENYEFMRLKLDEG